MQEEVYKQAQATTLIASADNTFSTAFLDAISDRCGYEHVAIMLDKAIDCCTTHALTTPCNALEILRMLDVLRCLRNAFRTDGKSIELP